MFGKILGFMIGPKELSLFETPEMRLICLKGKKFRIWNSYLTKQLTYHDVVLGVEGLLL